MHIETRREGKRKKQYLAHSFRKGGKVRKARFYLGANLQPAELEMRIKLGEKELERKTAARSKISDPLETVLSKAEAKELELILEAGVPRITRLSEEDWQRFTQAFTYDTNAIEGSTIDSREVADILERGKWPDKSKQEISETYGVAKAVEFLRKTREHLSINLILQLHMKVFENSKSFAGQLRPKGVEVVVTDGQGGIVHRGAPAGRVKKLLAELIKWYEKNKGKYHPLVLAAVVHNQFENIHPFQDGNGRVGRLLLNNILIKHGLPPLNIELANRSEYYASLLAYERGHDLRPTIELLLKEYHALKRLLKR